MLLFKFVFSNFRRLSAQFGSMSKSERIFQLSFDPLTEKSEWIVIESEEKENDSTSKPLLATTSYLDMLNDTRRNNAFRQAIEKTVTKPCHVLDIGAGTGLLSLIAARAMMGLVNDSAEGGMVTACESYLPMVKLMRKVVRANGMDGKIRLINKRSDELEVGKDLPSRAHVLVSEILDSELLGEGLIPTLQHAHDNLLVENPLTVPYRATTYGQLVECPYLSELHDLPNKDAKALDNLHLIPSGMTDLLCVEKNQIAMHCDAIKEECKLLSEPFKVFDFDFWRKPDSSRETELSIKATADGTVHAIVSWWVLQLDSEGKIFYSTGPKWIRCSNEKESTSSLHASGEWCDHWKQCVWLTPNSGLPVLKDEVVQLHAIHDEISMSYDIRTHSKKEVGNSGISTQDDQIILSPERSALYGDHDWRYIMINAIQDALSQGESPLCVVADDSIFLTIGIANSCKSSHVISLFPGLGKKGLRYLEKAAAVNCYSMNQIEILKMMDLKLTLDSQQKKINFFVAEPFYYRHHSVLPWQNLRFWNDRTMLQPFLSSDAKMVPCRGLLKTCAVYLPDLWESRRCLMDIEGFNHSMVNTTLGACGNLPVTEDCPFLPIFLWQCGETKILSETATILEFDFTKPVSHCSGKAKVQFSESGMCHGFVVWIDWVMNENGEDNTVLSTGPDKRYWKQAVKLLRTPVMIKCDAVSYSTEFEAYFDPTIGDLVINHGFS